MDKATLVSGALKVRKASKGNTTKVAVVNTPTVKIDHSSDMPTKMPPTLRLTSLDLSAIKGWKVGSKYKLQLEVEMTSLSQGSEYDMIGQSPDKSTRASFKVTSVRTLS